MMPRTVCSCRYERWLLDVPVAGREAVLHLRVRRFFCTLAECVRRIFAEQIDGVTVRHGRFSALARHGMEVVALALGGRAGASHRVIDVLDDRSADGLTAWLEDHPSVEVTKA